MGYYKIFAIPCGTKQYVGVKYQKKKINSIVFLTNSVLPNPLGPEINILEGCSRYKLPMSRFEFNCCVEGAMSDCEKIPPVKYFY